MVEKIVLLDLNKVYLFGSEPLKSDLVINSMVRALKENHIFPPIEVYQISGRVNNCKIYTIFDGHRRAVSHYIANKSLLCKVLGKKYGFGDLKHLIQDTVLEDDNKCPISMQYKYVKMADSNYF